MNKRLEYTKSVDQKHSLSALMNIDYEYNEPDDDSVTKDMKNMLEIAQQFSFRSYQQKQPKSKRQQLSLTGDIDVISTKSYRAKLKKQQSSNVSKPESYQAKQARLQNQHPSLVWDINVRKPESYQAKRARLQNQHPSLVWDINVSKPESYQAKRARLQKQHPSLVWDINVSKPESYQAKQARLQKQHPSLVWDINISKPEFNEEEKQKLKLERDSVNSSNIYPDDQVPFSKRDIHEQHFAEEKEDCNIAEKLSDAEGFLSSHRGKLENMFSSTSNNRMLPLVKSMNYMSTKDKMHCMKRMVQKNGVLEITKQKNKNIGMKDQNVEESKLEAKYEQKNKNIGMKDPKVEESKLEAKYEQKNKYIGMKDPKVEELQLEAKDDSDALFRSSLRMYVAPPTRQENQHQKRIKRLKKERNIAMKHLATKAAIREKSFENLEEQYRVSTIAAYAGRKHVCFMFF